MGDVGTSKHLSLVLRHRPDAVGVALDPQGWVDVDTLLAALAAHGRTLTRDGHVFRCSSNGVWLVDAVAPSYLSLGD